MPIRGQPRLDVLGAATGEAVARQQEPLIGQIVTGP
jgi:hypothetical protein